MVVNVGDKVYPSKSDKRILIVVDVERVLYYGKMKTFVDCKNEEGDIIRRPMSSVILVEKSNA